VGLDGRYGNSFGKYATIQLSNGRIITRRVNERATKGIEFVTPHTDESSYGSHAKVLKLSDTPPVTYSPTYHINVVDATGVQKILDEHGDKIHRHLRDMSRGELAQTAVV